MNNKKISVIAVNWWAKDFANLLVESVFLKAKNQDDLEIILVDNSGELNITFNHGFGKIIKSESNIGHGAGLDLAINEAEGEYILILDIDSHILLEDWDEQLIEVMNNSNFKMICAEGGQLKPIRPLFMFFKKDDIDRDMSFRAVELGGINFDVGIQFYFKMLIKYGDKSVWRLPWRKTEYKNVLGNEYNFNNKRVVYHNWYGTRWYGKDGNVERDEIDGRKYSDFVEKKNNLFKQV